MTLPNPFLETQSSCGVAESRSEARAPSPPEINRLAQNVRGTGVAPGPQDRFVLDEAAFMEAIEQKYTAEDIAPILEALFKAAA